MPDLRRLHKEDPTAAMAFCVAEVNVGLERWSRIVYLKQETNGLAIYSRKKRSPIFRTREYARFRTFVRWTSNLMRRHGFSVDVKASRITAFDGEGQTIPDWQRGTGKKSSAKAAL